MARCHKHRGEGMAPEDGAPGSGRVRAKHPKPLRISDHLQRPLSQSSPPQNVGSAEAHTKYISRPKFSIKANILVITMSSTPNRFPLDISFGEDRWTGDICSALCKLAGHSPILLWNFLNSHSENSSLKSNESLFRDTSNKPRFHLHVNGAPRSIQGIQA